MSYQHSILPEGARLEMRLEPEVYGRWAVSYRATDPRYPHLDDWRVIEHLGEGEALDVLDAIATGFLADAEAQKLF
jgi:hypothetical protein